MTFEEHLPEPFDFSVAGEAVTMKRDVVYGRHGHPQTTGETMTTTGDNHPLQGEVATEIHVPAATVVDVTIPGMISIHGTNHSNNVSNNVSNNGNERAMITMMMTTTGELLETNLRGGSDTMILMTMAGMPPVIVQGEISVEVVDEAVVEEEDGAEIVEEVDVPVGGIQGRAKA